MAVAIPLPIAQHPAAQLRAQGERLEFPGTARFQRAPIAYRPNRAQGERLEHSLPGGFGFRAVRGHALRGY